MAAYKLSPRDAVEQTWDDVQAYAKKNGLRAEHVLPLILSTRTEEGHVAWEVYYGYELPKQSISFRDLFGASGDVDIASYTVDGETGEIVKSEYQTIEPTRTPAP